jgi:hypothetical protein
MNEKNKKLSRLTALLSVFVAILGTGCATSFQSPSPQQGAASVRVATSTGVTFALSNNPDYAPAIAALAAGIDAALSESATLDPAKISAFVRRICAAHDVRPADVPIFVNLATGIYQAYVTAYRPQIVSATDPNVLLYIQAFKGGLLDALAAVHG